MLAGLAEQARQGNVLEVEVDVPDAPVALTPHARGELLHIAREALSNITRHARASTARILLTSDDAHVRLEIADDGQGFAVDAAIPGGHFGLVNMADRAAALGGTMEIRSRRPGGTTIIVTIPPAASAVGPDAEPTEEIHT
jgi:signal transduction histidine kinase